MASFDEEKKSFSSQPKILCTCCGSFLVHKSTRGFEAHLKFEKLAKATYTRVLLSRKIDRVFLKIFPPPSTYSSAFWRPFSHSFHSVLQDNIRRGGGQKTKYCIRAETGGMVRVTTKRVKKKIRSEKKQEAAERPTKGKYNGANWTIKKTWHEPEAGTLARI